MIKKSTLAYAVFIFLFLPAVHANGVAAPGQGTDSKEVSVTAVPSALQIRESITLSKKPLPGVNFWDRLAQCETRQNWKDKGRWAGGLGIYTQGKFPDANMGTWERFGGEEFAPHPSQATKEQQIIVANRIAFLGWSTTVNRNPKDAKRMGVPLTYVWERSAVGLGGWGCYKSKSTGKYRMEKPRRYHADKPTLVPLAQFSMGERGALVRDLQTFLRIKVDGVYGTKTRAAHLRYLKKRNLSTLGVPPKNSPDSLTSSSSLDIVSE